MPDSFSPEFPPNRLSKQWHQSPAFNNHTPPQSSLSEAHDDVHRRDRNVASALSRPEHVPVIDLRQLTQRSRAKSRHPSHGINPMTPRTKDNGKGHVMTVDISPSQSSSLSQPRTSRSLARVPSPHFWMVNVPVLEDSPENDGVPASQAPEEVMNQDEHV